MYKILVSIILLVVYANAGFWSSVAGGVVANSLTSSNSNSKKSVDYKQTDEMKIQQALYGLGFYNSNLDGSLNTLESRTAINAFQKSYGLKEIGIISDVNKQHLLFLHELYTALIKNSKDKEKRNKLYDEIDKAISLIKGNN